ncbi:MAG: AroM family protein [Bacillota bacterium]
MSSERTGRSSSPAPQGEARTLGLLTIGQSPRRDVTPDIQAYLRALPGLQALRVLEAGALDGLAPAAIRRLAPAGGEPALVTRLRTGKAVLVAERAIPPLLEGQTRRLVEQGAEVLALLCTGNLPEIRAPVPILQPQPLMRHLVAAAFPGARLGVIVPLPEQTADARRRWEAFARTLTPEGAAAVESASPYSPDPGALSAAAASLRAWGAGVVVLDCMGYTPAMRRAVREICAAPVILPRTVVAGALAEVLS